MYRWRSSSTTIAFREAAPPLHLWMDPMCHKIKCWVAGREKEFLEWGGSFMKMICHIFFAARVGVAMDPGRGVMFELSPPPGDNRLYGIPVQN